MKRIKKIIRNNKNIFKIVVCVFAITILLFIFDVINISNLIGINSANWFSYFGAVIGGLLTFIGVLTNINYENSKKKEEQSLQYKPIIQPCLNDNKYFEGFGAEVIFKQEKIEYNKKMQRIVLQLKNKGRGETKNFEVKSVKIIETSSNIDLFVDSENNNELVSDVEIIPDGNFVIYYSFPKSIITNNKKTINEYVIIETIVKYKDYVEYYEYENHFLIKVLIKDKNSIDYYKNKKGGKYNHDVNYFKDKRFKIKIKSSFEKVK